MTPDITLSRPSAAHASDGHSQPACIRGRRPDGWPVSRPCSERNPAENRSPRRNFHADGDRVAKRSEPLKGPRRSERRRPRFVTATVAVFRHLPSRGRHSPSLSSHHASTKRQKIAAKGCELAVGYQITPRHASPTHSAVFCVRLWGVLSVAGVWESGAPELPSHLERLDVLRASVVRFRQDPHTYPHSS